MTSRTDPHFYRILPATLRDAAGLTWQGPGPSSGGADGAWKQQERLGYD